MGRVNNQEFVCIPHARLVEKLAYKAQLVGINVILTEESYTSKASFLDQDLLPVYDPTTTEKHKFSGRRLIRKRGLYKSQSGSLISSDCNGSANIIRKVIPNAFAEGVEVSAVIPVRLNPLRKDKVRQVA
jgi:putative transposase